VRTRCIPDGSKIWWDVRPHHAFPTLEFRFCDVCTRVDEAVCIAAILQAIIAKLWKLRRDNMTFRVYPADLIEENKWRAVRYGLDGKLIDFGKEEELPARELIRELIEWFIDDVVDELGSRKEVEYAFRILEEGLERRPAARHLRAHRRRLTNPRAVVDQLRPHRTWTRRATARSARAVRPHRPARDRVELLFARWALEEGKPLLGVCRGMQVLNVAAGGTLHQDCAEVFFPGSIKHDYFPTAGYARDYLAHEARLAPESRLRAIFGEETDPGEQHAPPGDPRAGRRAARHGARARRPDRGGGDGATSASSSACSGTRRC
jgi:hypothetical protein